MSIISTDLQLVAAGSAADATTAYTRIGGPSAGNPAVDPDFKIQGTNCIRNINVSTSIYPADAGTALNNFANINCTGKLIYSWRNHTIPTNLPIKGQYGGCAIWLSNGSTYATAPYKIFDLDGADTDLVGGWKTYAVDPTKFSGNVSGSLFVSNIASIGYSRKMLTAIAASQTMDYLDVTRYGSGLKLRDNSGISGAQGTLLELFQTDSTSSNAYGVITSVSGGYNVMGKLYIGGDTPTWPTSTDTQTALTYFKDVSQLVVWAAMPVSAGYYEVRVSSNATQHTVFQLGNYDPVTGLTSSGLTIKGARDVGAHASQQETPGTLTNVAMYTGSRIGAGQSFTCEQPGAKLDNVQFWMDKFGAPTGTMVAKLYAHSGTYGTSSIPTGAELATSDPVASTTLSTTATRWIKFQFSGANAYMMTEGTSYVVAVETTGGTSNATNYVNVKTQGSSVYPGNWSSNTGGTWTATATTDLVFKLYTLNPDATWKFTGNTAGNTIVRIYGSAIEDLFSANLNNNRRSITVSNCNTASSSTTLTTTGNWTTSFIVPGMQVTGTGIQANTYVNSIESTTSLTLTKAANATATFSSLTFTDKTEIIGTTFSNFGTITTNGAYLYNNTFQNLVTTPPISANAALVVDSATNFNGNITNCKFVNCNRAIKITAAGDYTFDALTFSGNNFDVDNASSGNVTITLTNGSNATTYVNTGGGNTVINSPRTFTVTNIIENSSVRIVKQSDLSTLGNVTVVSGSPSGLSNVSVASDTQNAGRYTVSYSFNYTADIPVYVIVFNTAYQAVRASTSLTNASTSFQIAQVIDRQYSNPA